MRAKFYVCRLDVMTVSMILKILSNSENMIRSFLSPVMVEESVLKKMKALPIGVILCMHLRESP